MDRVLLQQRGAMRPGLALLLRIALFPAFSAVGVAGAACSRGADPAGASASAAASADAPVVLSEPVVPQLSDSIEPRRRSASGKVDVVQPDGGSVPARARLEPPSAAPWTSTGTSARVRVLGSRTAVLTKGAGVRVDVESDSYDPPMPPEPRSIVTTWAMGSPDPPRSRECDGCMRLTTTPRGSRPPIHSYVFTEVAGGDSAIRGGYGGHVVGERVLLGGGGFGLVRYRPLGPARGTEAGAQRDSLGAGGFFGALLPFPHWDVQPIAGVFVGLGNLTYKLDSTQPYPNTKFFVVAPQLTLEVQASNLTQFGVGASYRVIEGSALASRLTADVSGPTAFGFILFGYR